jgi:transposase
MPTIADAGRLVTGGVDTHAEVHVAGVADQAGRVLGTGSSRPPPRVTGPCWPGCAATVSWSKPGLEGTGSYGAGLARYLAAEGIEVAEVIRPNRQARRRHGKSDPADGRRRAGRLERRGVGAAEAR